MENNQIIDRWGIVQLHVAAIHKEAWIESISLGYTMLEMALTYLLKSKASPSGVPVSDKKINKCNYLMELAVLARDERFLPKGIFDELDRFNKLRIKAIHKLLSETVTYAELELAAKSATPIYGKIQDLWRPVAHGLEVSNK